MRHLYKAENNYSNVFVVRDIDTDKAAIIDWDLSESEIDKLVKKFEADPYDESYWADSEWVDDIDETTFDRLGLFAVEHIA